MPHTKLLPPVYQRRRADRIARIAAARAAAGEVPPNEEGFAYTALGSMLRRIGETGRAEQVLGAALTIVRDYADQLSEGLILNNLGEPLRSTDVDRSRRYFTEAIELLGDCELPALLIEALIGLGDTELLAGEPDRAPAEWTQARDIIGADDTDRADGIHRRLAERSTPTGSDPRVRHA